LAGAVTVKRTWRAEGKNVNRMVDMREVENIMKALDNGWVISFPQGTTSAYAQGRKGTAKLVQQQRSIVIPIKINGFRRAFDKKGLKIKVTGVEPTMCFKPALDIDYDNDTAQQILDKANIDYNKKVNEWNDDELAALRGIINEIKVEGALRSEVQTNIKRLMDIGCYRGIRHRIGLPLRGQSTKNNARTRKGRKKTVANKKKATK
jgi:ribosomal protein uS13